jgi:hypothetical protein
MRIHMEHVNPPPGKNTFWAPDFDGGMWPALRWTRASWLDFLPPAGCHGFVFPQGGRRRNPMCRLRLATPTKSGFLLRFRTIGFRCRETHPRSLVPRRRRLPSQHARLGFERSGSTRTGGFPNRREMQETLPAPRNPTRSACDYQLSRSPRRTWRSSMPSRPNPDVLVISIYPP